MLDHVLKQRAQLNDSIYKSYRSEEDLSKDNNRILKSMDEYESPGFQILEDEDLVTDFDEDNKKKDKEEDEDITPLEKGEPLAFTSSGKAIYKSSDPRAYTYFNSVDHMEAADLNRDLYPLTQNLEQRQILQHRIKFHLQKSADLEVEDKLNLFKSADDSELDGLLVDFSNLQKGEELDEELEKSILTRVYDLFPKVENYTPEQQFQDNFEDIKNYHIQKSSLDSLKDSLAKSKSIHTREICSQYLDKAQKFEETFGFKHDSEEGVEKHKQVVASLLKSMDDQIATQQLDRLEKSGNDDELIKTIIIRDQFEKSKVENSL